MAFDYLGSQDTALGLIANFGFVGEIRRNTGEQDLVEGTVFPIYKKTAATMVTVPSVDSLIRFDDQFREEMRKGRARVFIVAAKGLTFNPEAGDNIYFESKLWKIGSGANGGVMPVNPAGTPVIFICGCMAGGEDPDSGTEVS